MTFFEFYTSAIKWYRTIIQKYTKVVIVLNILIELALFVFILQTGMKQFPLTAQLLWETAGSYQQLWGYRNRVQSNLHGRLEEVCPDYFYQEVMITAVREKLEIIKKETPYELLRVIRLLHFYNSLSSEIQHSECSQQWKYVDISWWIGHHYQYSVPYSWLMEKFDLSEIYISLFIIINSWIGLYCLYLITKRMTGSRIIGLFAVLFHVHFLKAMFGIGIVYALNLFPVMLVGQLLASPERTFKNIPKVMKYACLAVMLIAYGLNSILYQFFYPVYLKLSSIVIIMTLFLLSLIRLDRRLLLRALTVFIVYSAFLFPLKHYRESLFKPTGSGEVALSAMTWMLYERPNKYGFPYTDPVVTFVGQRDPYIFNNYQFLMFFHSSHSWGRIYFKDIITHRPWIFLEAWWKRLYTQIAFQRKISFGMYSRNEDLLVKLFYIGVVAFFTASFIPGLINLIWIPAAVVFLQLFGIDMLMTVIHAHSPYSAVGISLLFSMLPGFIFAPVMYLLRYLLVRFKLRESI